MATDRRVAIVGAGLIGSAWAIVFARAGWSVSVFDSDGPKIAISLNWIRDRLADLTEFGFIDDPDLVMAKVRPASSLKEAVLGADYIQESVLERTDVKREVFSRLGEVIGGQTLVGSSSSGIPASDYTDHVGFRERCLVAHPVNPPYLIPVVELVPAPWTDSATTRAVRDLMVEVGQKPVVLSREIEGFVLNRLQGALLMECWKLVEEGIASVADIDTTVSDGLGLRWSFMGPFETIDLNARGGVADYAHRLGGLYQSIVNSRGQHGLWSADLIRKVEMERRAALPEAALDDRAAWRDRRLMSLARHKAVAALGYGE